MPLARISPGHHLGQAAVFRRVGDPSCREKYTGLLVWAGLTGFWVVPIWVSPAAGRLFCSAVWCFPTSGLLPALLAGAFSRLREGSFGRAAFSSHAGLRGLVPDL